MGSKRLLSSSQGLVLVGTWDNGALASCSDAGACRTGYNPQIAIPFNEVKNKKTNVLEKI